MAEHYRGLALPARAAYVRALGESRGEVPVRDPGMCSTLITRSTRRFWGAEGAMEQPGARGEARGAGGGGGGGGAGERLTQESGWADECVCVDDVELDGPRLARVRAGVSSAVGPLSTSVVFSIVRRNGPLEFGAVSEVVCLICSCRLPTSLPAVKCPLGEVDTSLMMSG